MKIFRTAQISSIDKYTIEHEPISDLDLMERASVKVVDFLLNHENYWGKVAVFCGPGNNGGDGLAITRLLARHTKRFQIGLFLVCLDKTLSPSAQTNLERLNRLGTVPVKEINCRGDIPTLSPDTLVVDALFGAGLTRPLEGFAAEVVQVLNQSACRVLSVDIPSGLMGEENRPNHTDSIIKATLTLTFQFPKLAFLLPENEQYVGQWYVLPIGLHPEAIKETPSNYFFVDAFDIRAKLQARQRFSHKGNFGHALLIAGSYGKMGAAILAAKACLRSGVGLLTVHLPHKTYPILQTALPESMADIDDSDLMFTSVGNLDPYSAIAIGPALGLKVNSQRGFKQLLEKINSPLVIDADGINILSLNPDWQKLVPPGTILTPHPGEFDRLTGSSENGYARLKKAIDLAIAYRWFIVLKGAFTATVTPEGKVYFNSTGNPGMATAGSGDALTGVVLGLLAQKYPPEDAAVLGVYLHGLAGNMAACVHGENGLIASDIIDNLGKAFSKLQCVERNNLTDEGFFPSLYDTENGVE